MEYNESLIAEYAHLLLKMSDEADFAESERFGLRCVLKRSPHGILCGYVGIPKEHPYWGMTYNDDKPIWDLEVHGGITWAENCLPGEDPDGRWYLGFDTGHSCDFIPGMFNPMLAVGKLGVFTDPSRYKDANYVTKEIINLVTQLLNAQFAPTKKAITHDPENSSD